MNGRYLQMTDQQEAEKIVADWFKADQMRIIDNGIGDLEDRIAQALTKARQESSPNCTSYNRCIICAECEKVIVERCARVAERSPCGCGNCETCAYHQGIAQAIRSQE